MKPYPSVDVKDPEDVAEFCQYVSRQREQDIREYNNIQNTFVAGRKVNKIPTSSADVDPTDRLGDVNFTATYLYVLIDNSGTAEWRRAALASW